MIKLVYCFARKADLDVEAFARYLHDVHGPIGARIPGVRRLVQSVAIRDPRDRHDPSFDGMAELWFDDVEALLRARASEAWQAATDDEQHFIDHRRTAYFLSDERTVTAGPAFDTSDAHRFFSAHCFNQAWDLIAKPDRTLEEDEAMIRLGQASIWHWTQRPDCRARNLSIGYWQVSRIHAILGRADEARRYARLCLEHSRDEPPFFLAYAYEALGRAEAVAGNAAEAAQHRAEAARLAELVDDVDDRRQLLADLEERQ